MNAVQHPRRGEQARSKLICLNFFRRVCGRWFTVDMCIFAVSDMTKDDVSYFMRDGKSLAASWCCIIIKYVILFAKRYTEAVCMAFEIRKSKRVYCTPTICVARQSPTVMSAYLTDAHRKRRYSTINQNLPRFVAGTRIRFIILQ